jgi:hypothetical protein
MLAVSVKSSLAKADDGPSPNMTSSEIGYDNKFLTRSSAQVSIKPVMGENTYASGLNIVIIPIASDPLRPEDLVVISLVAPVH